MGEDDTTNTDREQARDPFLHHFNTPTAFNAPLDGIFELNVLRALTPEECSDVRREVQAIHKLQSQVPFDIMRLDVTTRHEFPDATDAMSDGFWSSHETQWPRDSTSTVYVSKYYQRSCWHEDLQDYTLEPCTGVVGTRVILCIELFLDQSNVILYRDILTTLETTLRQALAEFNVVQGFAHDISYSYMQFTSEQGWYLLSVSEQLLDMPLSQVLSDHSVRNCNDLDYFRLSPIGSCESDRMGFFESFPNASYRPLNNSIEVESSV